MFTPSNTFLQENKLSDGLYFADSAGNKNIFE